MPVSSASDVLLPALPCMCACMLVCADWHSPAPALPPQPAPSPGEHCTCLLRCRSTLPTRAALPCLLAVAAAGAILPLLSMLLHGCQPSSLPRAAPALPLLPSRRWWSFHGRSQMPRWRCLPAWLPACASWLWEGMAAWPGFCPAWRHLRRSRLRGATCTGSRRLWGCCRWAQVRGVRSVRGVQLCKCVAKDQAWAHICTCAVVCADQESSLAA